LIQDTHDDDGKRSKCEIEKDNVSVVEDILAVEIGVDLVPEECKYPNDVLVLLASVRLQRDEYESYLVEEVCNGLCKPAIRPSAVNKHESSKEAELTNSVVRRHNGGTALNTSNTNAHVRLLNHGDVVGTVSDSKSKTI
jgi:hypothetical protein